MFVQQGGSLTFGGTLDVSGNSAIGGPAQQLAPPSRPNPGSAPARAFSSRATGPSLSIRAPARFQTVTDVIADQTGVAASGGSWSLVKNGAGTTILTGTNALFRRHHDQWRRTAGQHEQSSWAISSTMPRSSSISCMGTFAGAISGSGSLTKPRQRGSYADRRQHLFGGDDDQRRRRSRFTTDSNLGAAGEPIRSPTDQGKIGTTNGTARGHDDQPAPQPCSLERAASTSPSIRSSGAGPISGPGAFSKTGPGDLTLTGVNTYAGGTIVSGGVLRFASDADSALPAAPSPCRTAAWARPRARRPNTVFSRNLSVGRQRRNRRRAASDHLERRHFGKRPIRQERIRGAPTDGRQYVHGRHAGPRRGLVGDVRRPAWSGGNRRDSERRHVSCRPKTSRPRGPSLWSDPDVFSASFASMETLTLNGVVSGGILTKAGPRNAGAQRRQYLRQHRHQGRNGGGQRRSRSAAMSTFSRQPNGVRPR